VDQIEIEIIYKEFARILIRDAGFFITFANSQLKRTNENVLNTIKNEKVEMKMCKKKKIDIISKQ
jgi:hypothetical protein